MDVAHRRREEVDTSESDEFLGIGCGGLSFLRDTFRDLIVNRGALADEAELTFHQHAGMMRAGILDDFLGHHHVVGEGLLRAVDNHRVIVLFHGFHRRGDRIGVVRIDKDRQALVLLHFHKSMDLGDAEEGALTLGDTDNDWHIERCCRFDHSLEAFRVGDIEVADRYLIFFCPYQPLSQCFHCPYSNMIQFIQMHDFIAIGDTATDVFIHLGTDSRAEVSGTPGQSDYKLSLPFSAKVPYTEAIRIDGVGNAPNAAVNAAKLGLRAALVAHVGDDEPGKDTLKVLEQQGVDTQFVVTEPGKHTNYSYMIWYQDDRTVLRRNEEFAYTLPDLGAPKWVYVSSIGSATLEPYEKLADYLEAHPEVKLAFQPGSKEIPLGQKLSRLYKRTDIYFSNIEEAEAILGIDTLGIQELLKRFHELGPKIVVITDGPRGAYAYDGTTMYTQLPYPDPKPPVERTGAGDAFSSTTVVALALGKDLQSALKWGAVNSMSVVQEVGAQKGLLSKEEIEEYLKKGPSEF